MKFWTDYHPDSCVLLPALAVTLGRCENPDCASVHAVRFTLSVLLWSFNFDIWSPFSAE